MSDCQVRLVRFGRKGSRRQQRLHWRFGTMRGQTCRQEHYFFKRPPCFCCNSFIRLGYLWHKPSTSYSLFTSSQQRFKRRPYSSRVSCQHFAGVLIESRWRNQDTAVSCRRFPKGFRKGFRRVSEGVSEGFPWVSGGFREKVNIKRITEIIGFAKP